MPEDTNWKILLFVLILRLKYYLSWTEMHRQADTQACTHMFLIWDPVGKMHYNAYNAYNILKYPLSFEDVLYDMLFLIIVLLFSCIQAYGS